MKCGHRPSGVRKSAIGDCDISGELRHRIVIETVTETPDGIGGFTESWSTYSTVWARIVPINAVERLFASRLEDNITHQITIRYLAGVTPKMRISFDSRYFQIKGVYSPMENKQYLELNCIEGQAT